VGSAAHMGEKCPKCGTDVQPQHRYCHVCGTDVGFPNVRAANIPPEREALEARVNAAWASARATGSETKLKEFESAVRNASAVMNRSAGALFGWVNGPSPLFKSFHRQVEEDGRPVDAEWDQQREAAESTINPFVYRELIFAALSLDGTGMTYYGPYAVTLRTVTIEDRSSAFEENPFVFNKRHHVVAGQAPPPGYRAKWSEKSQIAVAKLHSKVRTSTSEKDFPSILMEERRGESDCDFVEVHIYGTVNREGIAQVVGPQPPRRPDQLLWRQAKRRLKELGAVVIETP
jgi:hypothetical protein